MTREEHYLSQSGHKNGQHQQQQQHQPSDLGAYTFNPNNQGHNLESLTNDNRLPPMASYPSPNQNRLSVSPNNYLSPSRKRSFSATDMDPNNTINSEFTSASTLPKRLSSIKSILNHGFADSDANVNPENDLNLRRGTNNLRLSPGRYSAAPSPNLSTTGMATSIYSTSPSGSGAGSALNSARDSMSESDRTKADRREMLQREAEKMREALKAKERELAELGIDLD
ncbi:hypothetical protein DID88_005268 [Monilinia fructigena]|uniref:Uncharacterized protein n=1 Tax=Monilinia fructigena TaxID=38457 RepID=A0A395J030_9HELO|nr:hypothetical protein DID88_005268 [Monilinia fructigena]